MAYAPEGRSRDCAETYKWYVAQKMSQIDAEIAEKGPFWMETAKTQVLLVAEAEECDKM